MWQIQLEVWMISIDVYSVKRFQIIGVVNVWRSTSEAQSERRFTTALLSLTLWHHRCVCWSRSCFKTLLKNVIACGHTIVDSSCTIVCWTEFMFCSDFLADSILCRKCVDDSVIGCICERNSIYCNNCESGSIFVSDCLVDTMFDELFGWFNILGMI